MNHTNSHTHSYKPVIAFVNILFWFTISITAQTKPNILWITVKFHKVVYENLVH